MKRVLFFAVALTVLLAARPSDAITGLRPTVRDGHADWAFLYGTWKTHYRRLRHILANDHTWYDCYGSSVVRPFWNGSANLEDGDLRCPKQYIHGMTMRLYSFSTHQWSLYWGTQRTGLAMPPQVGHFTASGVGDFFSDDTWQGKPVVVRYRWRMLERDRPYFEQAFSTDHGKTWETNWTTVYTRVSRY